MPEPCVNRLIAAFNDAFRETEQTILVAGGEEPIYLPADNKYKYHRIIFRNDYFASALHEISHWCIAGSERRQLIDFGYWYEEDGRTVAQQQAFERVEIKPQAIEWIISRACGLKFRVSIDNLNGEQSPTESIFKDNIYQQVLRYLNSGVPERTQHVIDTLGQCFQPELTINESLFRREDI